MEKTVIINLLTNSGLNVFGMDSDYVYFQDPSCIFPVFDSFFNFVWLVALIFAAIMLIGWGALYIKNGVNINSLFNNAKTLILILCVLSLVKPIVNVVYGDNLFAKQCEQKRVSLTEVEKLLALREKHFGRTDQAMLYETFVVSDTGKVKSVSVEESTEE